MENYTDNLKRERLEWFLQPHTVGETGTLQTIIDPSTGKLYVEGHLNIEELQQLVALITRYDITAVLLGLIG